MTHHSCNNPSHTRKRPEAPELKERLELDLSGPAPTPLQLAHDRLGEARRNLSSAILAVAVLAEDNRSYTELHDSIQAAFDRLEASAQAEERNWWED